MTENTTTPAPAPAAPAKKKTPLVRWQPPMIAVMIACAPVVAASVYRFGWRSLAVIAVACAVAFVTEWLFTRARPEPVTSAALVTGLLLALTLPPAVPFWIAAVGAFVGVMFGKELFGGFGRNVFNPALVGRCFIYVCFPVAMTGQWTAPLSGGWAGFARWSGEAINGVTGATPLYRFSHEGFVTPHVDLFLGARAGCMGETMIAALLLGAAYLLVRKIADWRLMLAPVLGALGMGALLKYSGVAHMPDPIWTLLAGGFLFGVVFMVTEPVSAPRAVQARWVYGLFIGALTVVIRRFGTFPENIMFAILIGNVFAPTLDLIVRNLTGGRKGAA
jgi:Na+-transporting NADH:ubiquinone oxidoreductase subunit B